MGSMGKDVSAYLQGSKLRGTMIAGVIGWARHITAAPSRGAHWASWARKRSKLGWLRTRANTTHERRGYVDRLRNGTSLLLLTGHSVELNLMDHGVMHVVEPRPDLRGWGGGGCWVSV